MMLSHAIVAAALRRQPECRRPDHAAERTAVRDRRRDAAGLHVSLERDRSLDSGVVYRAGRSRTSRRHSNNWKMIGRLKPGATLAQAQQELDAHRSRATTRRFPQFHQILKDAGYRRLRDRPAGRGRPRRAARAVSALGRRRVRSPHRLRQHREPRRDPVERTVARDGDAPRDRRGARRVSRASS